ncbi:MAG: M16 family metallopeptidase, partial [Minisyncoccales bacterium]
MDFKKIVFKNKLRILLIPRRDIQTTTVLILVKAGSKHEKKRENGISHFLEHMCFKGTKSRPSPLLVAEPLDEIGAVYNAFTSQDFTGYWIKSDSAHFDFVMEMVADIFLNSIFDPKEIERERSVIEEEINMVYDNPREFIENLWLKLLYKNQSAGWPITGTKETLKNINRSALISYKNKNYIGQNTLLCLAGNFSFKRALSLIKKYFSQLKAGEKQKRILVKEKQKKPAFLQQKR